MGSIKVTQDEMPRATDGVHALSAVHERLKYCIRLGAGERHSECGSSLSDAAAHPPRRSSRAPAGRALSRS